MSAAQSPSLETADHNDTPTTLCKQANLPALGKKKSKIVREMRETPTQCMWLTLKTHSVSLLFILRTLDTRNDLLRKSRAFPEGTGDLAAECSHWNGR